jgi:CheY-like chemotaxis protein
VIDVLVVDDDFMVARIHRGYVERLDGFRVVGEVHTGGEVVDAVRRLRPDLVLLDVYLPDRNGLDVLRDLRSDAALTADVIVVTAARDVEVVVRDSGPGVPAGMEREVFRRGVSSNTGERGIGLSLVHLVCTRRGGEATASSAGGSTFTARLPADPTLVAS